ncbi:MAG TPA: hypothetical protein VNP96_06410 [Solirubrobacterales bacterium]|nr:hypothetical protein [Solirubrobacterales bacterium]
MRTWSDKFDIDVAPFQRLPPDVVRARRRSVDANRNNEKILEPRIEFHLSAYEVALGELEALHVQTGELGDFDIDGETRQAAAWLISGRVIGLLNAALALARARFASEMIPILRAAHEATELLSAVSMNRDSAILRDWLRDHQIKVNRVRTAIDRNQKQIAAEMRGFGGEDLRRTRGFMDGLYEDHSQLAHVKRSRLLEITALDCRQMPANTHPAVTVRAYHVYLLSFHVMHAVGVVGFGLGISRGDDAVLRTQGTLAQLAEVEKRAPIDPDTLRGNEPRGGEAPA